MGKVLMTSVLIMSGHSIFILTCLSIFLALNFLPSVLHLITAFGVPPWSQLILQVASPWLPLSSNGFWQLQAPSSGESYFAISASICSAQVSGFLRFGWPAVLEFYKNIANYFNINKIQFLILRLLSIIFSVNFGYFCFVEI